MKKSACHEIDFFLSRNRIFQKNSVTKYRDKSVSRVFSRPKSNFSQLFINSPSVGIRCAMWQLDIILFGVFLSFTSTVVGRRVVLSSGWLALYSGSVGACINNNFFLFLNIKHQPHQNGPGCAYFLCAVLSAGCQCTSFEDLSRMLWVWVWPCIAE